MATMNMCGIQQILGFGLLTCSLALCMPTAALAAERAENAAAADPILEFQPLSEISVDVRPPDAELPPDRATDVFQPAAEVPDVRSDWYCREFHWEAPEFWHRPLYFDDVPLERYGQSCHPLAQPVKSGARFFLTLPILPYKAGIDRPCDMIPNLGYYRVGSCNPGVRQWLPLEADAALFESGAWVAAFLLLP
jgi:hypothetical protein